MLLVSRTWKAPLKGMFAGRKPSVSFVLVRSLTLSTILGHSADNFDQNLCAWGNLLDITTTVTENAFIDTNCPSQADPVFGATANGPFCFICV
jgi:hypothetical protein